LVTFSVAAGEPHFRLVQALLANDPAKQWIIITTAEAAQDQDAFARCLLGCINTCLYGPRYFSGHKIMAPTSKKTCDISLQASSAHLHHLND
jgi:hypothetical protein